VGRSGLEQEYDDTLRGTPGMRYIEVDARGRLVRE
jgi:cell division protein FtsI/penicillin-binding protein 2